MLKLSSNVCKKKLEGSLSTKSNSKCQGSKKLKPRGSVCEFNSCGSIRIRTLFCSSLFLVFKTGLKSTWEAQVENKLWVFLIVTDYIVLQYKIMKCQAIEKGQGLRFILTRRLCTGQARSWRNEGRVQMKTGVIGARLSQKIINHPSKKE